MRGGVLFGIRVLLVRGVLFGGVFSGVKNIVLAQSWHKVGTKNEVK